MEDKKNKILSWLIVDVLRSIKGIKKDDFPSPRRLIELVDMIYDKRVSKTSAKKLMRIMVEEERKKNKELFKLAPQDSKEAVMELKGLVYNLM